MQINEIILYGNNNEVRVVSFHTNTINIITGRAEKGKTALIPIIDYCLGSSECLVPEGVIRNNVAWYGLKLQFSGTQAVILRKAPERGRNSNTIAHLEYSEKCSHPVSPPAQPNSNIDAVEEFLSNQLGIASYKHTPPEGQTRAPLKANIRHALGYCIQKQTEIASNEVLFHGHSDNWVRQAAKDTLPYFLGLIPENHIELMNEYRNLKRDLRKKEQELSEASKIVGADHKKGLSLIGEAQQLGLLKAPLSPQSALEIRNVLSPLLNWNFDEQVATSDSSEISELRRSIEQHEVDIESTNEQLEAANIYQNDIDGFKNASNSHHSRLEIVEIFKSSTSPANESCPLCSGKIEKDIPSINAIKKVAQSISINLGVIKTEEPKIAEFVVALKKNKSDLQEQIKSKRTIIEGYYRQSEESKKLRDSQLAISRFLGRASLWVDSIVVVCNKDMLSQEIKALEERIDLLERQIGENNLDEKIASVSSRIAETATKYAKELKLEYSQNPTRLDLKNITIIADREDSPIPLKNMGSAENWLGYHLVALFSLHKRFVEADRPVPRFIFLDQPSQVYFPKEQTIYNERNNAEKLKDVDRESLKRIYTFIFDRIKELQNQIQIIITDHAELNMKEFKDATIESWWEKEEALIPSSWIKSKAEKN